MDHCHARSQHSADTPGHGKTVFSGRTQAKEEMMPLSESHPQKEKVERYAASFRKLADTFYGMPYRKEFLSGGQLNRIISDTSACVCSRCYQREICWGERAGETMRNSEHMLRVMEEGDEEAVRQVRSEWMSACGRSAQYFQVLNEGFREERQNLVWDNRMIESRLAVAQQLTEISGSWIIWQKSFMILCRQIPGFRKNFEKPSAGNTYS